MGNNKVRVTTPCSLGLPGFVCLGIGRRRSREWEYWVWNWNGGWVTINQRKDKKALTWNGLCMGKEGMNNPGMHKRMNNLNQGINK